MASFIVSRLSLARRQLQSARNNMTQNDVETAANRAFLAAENAAAAAIAKSGERVAPVHGQIRARFEDLCDQGLIPQKFKGLLAQSYRFRLRGDYGRGIHRGKSIPHLTPTAMRETIDSVAELIDIVTRMPRKRRP
jgi:uncharacterized protein (UPF0332 family)